MEEITRGTSRLLSGLRSDGKALRVCRYFVNVMDTNNISGAGPHVDLEASMGTVVVKLTGEDTIQEALHVFDPDSDTTKTPLQMPKGHGAAKFSSYDSTLRPINKEKQHQSDDQLLFSK